MYIPQAPINPSHYRSCTMYTGSLLSLGSGVLFGLLLAIGATQTTANRSNFTLLLGKDLTSGVQGPPLLKELTIKLVT